MPMRELRIFSKAAYKEVIIDEMKSLSSTMSNTLVNSICQCISNALNSECEDQIRQRRRKTSTVNQNKNAPSVSEKPSKTSTSTINCVVFELFLRIIHIYRGKIIAGDE
jgi:hypothetical protein